MTSERGADLGVQRTSRQAKAVLIAVIGLYLVSETALGPFLPQLFHRLYGIDDPSAVGLYLWVCRIAGLVALPLWGLAARRWTIHRLVLTGLCAAAVMGLLLGMAPSYPAFTVLSAASVAANASMLLAYPAFIAEYSRAAAIEENDGEHARLAGIRSFVVIFHVGVLVATMAGTGVLALPQPRLGISAFAALDVLLAVLVYRTFGQLPLPAVVPKVVREERQVRRRPRRLPLLLQAALIGVAFDFSLSVARPFFTELTDDMGGGSVQSAVLFFLPSLSALAVLPLARYCHDRLGDWLLPAALTLAAVGLGWQYVAADLVAMGGGRLLFGLGLGLGQVAVELWAFRAAGTDGPAFTGVQTVRSVSLLIAPLVAAAAVSRELALPLAIAAAVLVVASLISFTRVLLPMGRRAHEETSHPTQRSAHLVLK